MAKRGEKLREIGEDFGGVVVSFPGNGVSSDRVVLKGAKDCIEGAKKRILEIVDELESMVSLECVVAQKYHRNIMGAKGVHVQKVTSEHNVQIKFPDRDPANRGQGMMNGNSSPVEENGEAPGSPPASPRKCDVITIIGSKDNAEAAKQALLVRFLSVIISIQWGLTRFRHCCVDVTRCHTVLIPNCVWFEDTLHAWSTKFSGLPVCAGPPHATRVFHIFPHIFRRN